MLTDESSELKRLRKEIEERDDFIAFVGHELRNPMHALSLQLASARAMADAAGHAAIIERLAKTQATLTRYIDRASLLLDVAQQQQREYPVVLSALDLQPLLAKFFDHARAEADYHSVALRFDAPKSCRVQTDPRALEHVVGNLLTNAFKHAQCQEVVLSLRDGGEFAQIVIADNGRGISDEDQQRVFRKFDRGSKPSLRGGSGLGLWIAQRLIHALNGTISLESRLTQGSRFVLQIPVRPMNSTQAT